MENNRPMEFWLTIGSLASLVCCFLFVAFCIFKEQFIFKKEYCLALIPAMVYFMLQFVINYVKITEDENK